MREGRAAVIHADEDLDDIVQGLSPLLVVRNQVVLADHPVKPIKRLVGMVHEPLVEVPVQPPPSLPTYVRHGARKELE